jgi:hypothetical protein
MELEFTCARAQLATSASHVNKFDKKMRRSFCFHSAKLSTSPGSTFNNLRVKITQDKHLKAAARLHLIQYSVHRHRLTG